MPATLEPRESEPHSFIKGPGLTEDLAESKLAPDCLGGIPFAARRRSPASAHRGFTAPLDDTVQGHERFQHIAGSFSRSPSWAAPGVSGGMKLFLFAIVVVFFFAEAPDGSFGRFQRDLGNLIGRCPLECVAALDHPRHSRLASQIVDFTSAMSDGARATRDLSRTVLSGDQPELRYERHLDDIFEQTVHPTE